jgi:hypothetical protein
MSGPCWAMVLRMKVFALTAMPYAVRRASFVGGQMAIAKSLEVVQEGSWNGGDCSKKGGQCQHS